MTEGRTELLYATFRERVEYHLLSALVRGKASLGREDEAAKKALALLEARLKAVARWIRVYGFIDVATQGQHASATNLSRRARALISIPGATLDSARRILTAERIEFLWTEHLATTLDDDETAGVVDRVELVDGKGRTIGAGRLRYGSLVWDFVEYLTEDECAARVMSANELDADASRDRGVLPERAAALAAEANYQRSIVAAASFWRETYAGLGGSR